MIIVEAASCTRTFETCKHNSPIMVAVRKPYLSNIRLFTALASITKVTIFITFLLPLYRVIFLMISLQKFSSWNKMNGILPVLFR